MRVPDEGGNTAARTWGVVGWWERPTQEDRAAPSTPPRIVRSKAEDDTHPHPSSSELLVISADFLLFPRRLPKKSAQGHPRGLDVIRAFLSLFGETKKSSQGSTTEIVRF